MQGSDKVFRTLFEEAPLPYQSLDENGNIIQVNQTWVDVLGYSKDEVIGRDFSDVLHPDDVDEFQSCFSEFKESGEVHGVEFRLGKKNGDMIIVSYDGKVEYDEQGEFVRTHCIFKDVTERREMEERNEFIHSLLRHTIKDKANSIQGYHELLRDFDLPEEVKNYLEKADEAVQDSVDMIKKVKKFLEIGRFEFGEFSVNSAIDTAVNKNRIQASEKGIEIDFEKPDCKVQGDPLLKELFSNLIENSIKHSDCDKIRIYGREQGNECIATVEDDGEGIPDDLKEKIFEIGFKKGKSAGFGLGLYLVKEIAERYGGSVEIKDSELGGARFDVHLQRTK